MTMAAGLAVTGCSRRGGSNGTDGMPAEQSKEVGGGGTGSSKDDAARVDDDALHLTFYYPVNVDGSAVQLIEKICTDFNTEDLDIFVEPAYAGNYDDTVTKIQIAMQDGTPPNVFVSLATQRFTMVSTSMAMPPDELIGADGEEGEAYIGDFPLGSTEGSYVDEKMYSILFQRSTMVLYYNRDTSKGVGLNSETPPATWEELVEYGQELTDDECYSVGTVLDSGSAWWAFTNSCLQSSIDRQNLVSEDGKSVYFSTPENVKVFQFRLDLQNEYKCMTKGIVQWTDLPTQFLAGGVVMIYHTTGNMTNIHDNADFGFGTTSLPTHKGMGAPTGDGNFYISNDISKNRVQAAWGFTKFATPTDGAAQWSLDTGYMATGQSCSNTDLVRDYYVEAPQASAAYKQLPYARPGFTIYNATEIWKVLGDNIQAAIVGNMSAREALDMAQEQAEGALSEYQ